MTRYVFRVGPSPNYRDKERSFPTIQEAREAARNARAMGWSTSRIRRVDADTRSNAVKAWNAREADWTPERSR